MIIITCDKCDAKLEYKIGFSVNFGNTHQLMVPLTQEEQAVVQEVFPGQPRPGVILCKGHTKEYMEIYAKHQKEAEEEISEWLSKL